MGVVDWLGGVVGKLEAKDLGSILGGVGGAYGAYTQGKAAKEILKLQKDDYYEEKKRKKETQARLDIAAQQLGNTSAYPNASLPLN